MSQYTQQLAKDLRDEVARKEDDLARLRAGARGRRERPA